MSTRTKAPTWFAPVFVLIWSAGTLLFDGIVCTAAVRQIAASSYSRAPGTILESKVSRHSGRKGSIYSAGISYRYSVAGVERTSKRWRYGAWSTSSGWAKSEAARFPVGSGVDVHYNPRDPADAVLVTGLQGQDGVLMLFLAPFNAMMVGGWAVFLRPRSPMGARVWEAGGVTRVRVMGLASPLIVGLAALGLACCVGVFIVAACFIGALPPPAVPLGIIGLAAAAGLAAGLGRSLVLASGRNDLVIDPVARVLTLPARFEKSGERAVPFSAIKSVSNLDVPLKDRTVAGRVEMSIDGRSAAVRLAQQSDRTQAEALAAWLREQLKS